MLVLGPLLLPDFRDPTARRLDLASAAQSLAAVLAVIYGLKRMTEHGPGWLPALSIVAGLAIGVVFLRRFVAFGVYLFIAQYLQSVLGLSPLQTGLWSMPYSAGFIVGSMVTPALVRRVRPAYVMASGLGLAAVGFAMLTQVGGASGLTVLVTATVVFSAGLAPAFTLATDLVVGNAPPERAGAASAISETSSEFGGALGIALLGSIGTAVYRGAMAHAVPAGVPREAAEAARSTIGGALAVAGQLPDELAAALLGAARAAFAQSLVLTAALCAAIVLGAAVMALVLLRRVGCETEDLEPVVSGDRTSPGG